MTIQAYAAHKAGGKLEPFEYELGSLKPDEVEINLEYCGICHSDLSMLKNDWGLTRYPFVPGHEAIGQVAAVGNMVNNLTVGQYVGLGWRARSCLVCDQCLSGHHNRCLKGEDVIIGRHGAYANKVHCQALFAFPLPENINIKTAGPLFCGGITVFSPIIQNNIKPTDHVAVVGIGGLGHMAIKFLDSWGCEVTALSTNPEKEKETKEFGADHFLNTGLCSKESFKSFRYGTRYCKCGPRLGYLHWYTSTWREIAYCWSSFTSKGNCISLDFWREVYRCFTRRRSSRNSKDARFL